MTKSDFLIFYNAVVKVLGERLAKEQPLFRFVDNSDALYEEYLIQKNLIRTLYEKGKIDKNERLDRHKVCACMTVSIIKIRLISCKNIKDVDNYYDLLKSRVNEQLAFMSSWELFKSFVLFRREKEKNSLELPQTFHNASFLDTITRSLFFSNQINTLSVPLIANIFFLLEKYCEKIDT